MSDIKRVRSPNYPALSLPAALDAARKLHFKINRHPAPRDVIAKEMGFGGLNGASLGAISALLKYGVLEKSGEDLRLSERAMKLIAARSVEEHVEALYEAATAPALFAELSEQFKGAPPSDELLRAYLIRKNFAHSAIPQVIQSFRETLELVTRESNGYSASEVGNKISPTEEEVGAVQDTGLSPKITPAGEQEFISVPLSSGVRARVLMSGGMIGVKELEKLIRVLKLQKELLADDSAEDGSSKDEGENA